ncbi:Asr1405/Asl0597 family protein [Pantanalinema sp. GBBB05]|uniref:Asr1405/Asl0597 family protein n=1 Tax=Pantanalinema sp. GBBB05 TaxID=2604139 RepID=UPI001D80DC28|nr:hypothetical protein [Pantanalinema sp. GBBB05]
MLFDSPVPQTIQVSRIDRWCVHQRLQELMIPCQCLADGSLQVEINTCLAAVLLHTAMKQFVCPRQDLVDWLERCWHS